jgi:hypothetical protein
MWLGATASVRPGYLGSIPALPAARTQAWSPSYSGQAAEPAASVALASYGEQQVGLRDGRELPIPASLASHRYTVERRALYLGNTFPKK